jgi:hypothetical protein
LSSQRNHTPSGTWSWKCGDQGPGTYAGLLDAGLVTPEIFLGPDGYLHYWQWMEIDDYPLVPGYTYDGALVEISAGGAPWEEIYPDAGYPMRIRTQGAPGPLPPETPVYAGAFDWHEVHFDLAGYAGPVRLRFRFGTNFITELEGWYIDDLQVEGFNTAFSGVDPIPEPHLILTPDPNPFAGETTLCYRLPHSTRVLLQIYDLSGRLVRTLVTGIQSAGAHRAWWDGRDAAGIPVPSGVYLTRLDTEARAVTGRVVLAR